MIEVVYAVGASLDGYIATPDGGVEWMAPFSTAGEDHGFGDFYASVDALLMGSRTYEVGLEAGGGWRGADKQSWVFTHRDLPVVHPSVTLTSEDPSNVVESLQSRRFQRAWLMGGGKLATSFRAKGLISRYEIGVLPILLGDGIPMFADPSRLEKLRLVKVKPYASGIVSMTYEPE